MCSGHNRRLLASVPEGRHRRSPGRLPANPNGGAAPGTLGHGDEPRRGDTVNPVPHRLGLRRELARPFSLPFTTFFTSKFMIPSDLRAVYINYRVGGSSCPEISHTSVFELHRSLRI